MIEQLRALPLKQKIGQLFFIGIPGPQVDEATRELLAEITPGGVCLFARNIREAEQTRLLLGELGSLSIIKPFLSVDQEGGLVDRLRRIMTPMPAANKLRNANDTAEIAAIIAESLRILGFNMDFAPVVDVVDEDRAKYTNGLFSRAYGTSKEDAFTLGGCFLETLQQHGIIGCIKHFPGLGAANVDSHEELPQVNITRDEIFSTDLFPYYELLKTGAAKAIMVAHAAFPQVNLQETDQNGRLLPSSLSKNFITNLLRDELGFEGLVITDDLEMGAIVKNYGIGEACKMAVVAGADMLAICADPMAIRDGYNAVLRAAQCGEITEDRIDKSLFRISTVKKEFSSPLDLDLQRLEQLSNEVAALNERLNRA